MLKKAPAGAVCPVFIIALPASGTAALSWEPGRQCLLQQVSGVALRAVGDNGRLENIPVRLSGGFLAQLQAMQCVGFQAYDI